MDEPRHGATRFRGTAAASEHTVAWNTVTVRHYPRPESVRRRRDQLSR
ncbi:hypothetical protein Rhow_003315 [Rhodococcus wratislaviensis]|uniref:Uncharacterized protein n=1 Tax=Rhodococcus wratislaviensis TaxID=44752 RepID=A0A402BZE7_RHOWR|nr:hypothetical protein Rhow_003315 [Rhodococcus wratislaviensis]